MTGIEPAYSAWEKRFEAERIVPAYEAFRLLSHGFFKRRCCALLRRIAPCCVLL